MTKPILIIGGGPVGMTMASELVRYGLPVRIIDKAAHRTDKSKALVLWSRTLELLDRGMGGERFVERGFKVDGVTFAQGDKEVGHACLDTIDSRYNYALMIPQSETERLLEEYLAGQGVTVERETEATALAIRDDGVSAVVQKNDGTSETIEAEWLIGCDGAHSIVRRTLDLPFVGETNPSDWMLADVHMTGYPRSDRSMSIYWHHDGVLIILPITPGRYRLIVDVPRSPGDQPRTLSLEQMQSLVDQRGPAGTRLFDPVWLSGFRINERKVADYQQGRIFLAGDAAHIHSPAGGQGMNTGMQDAFNLAWKLALVFRQACRPALLETYSHERSQVGDAVLKSAGRLTAVATLRNPVAQALRNLAGHVLLGWEKVGHALAEQMSETTIHYPESLLNGTGRSADAQPGERFAPRESERPAGSGNDSRFVLHAVAGPMATDLTSRFPELIDPILRPLVPGAALTLVRPDGYVSVATNDPDHVTEVLERFGRH